MPTRAAVSVSAIVLSLAAAAGAAAQTPANADEWKITDNSFLVEEAFNQDPGIVQHIFGFQRQSGGNWQFTFTQEWPAPSMRHQLSYTLPVQSLDGSRGLGDVLLNYRLQVLEEGPGRPAFAPRLSVILPSGSTSVGAGSHGIQVNLPFSKRRGDLYFHGNGGFTWQRFGAGPALLSPAAAGSLIYRARQMLNLMLEGVVVGQSAPVAQATPAAGSPSERTIVVTVSPGVRGGWNVTDDKQIIVGAAVPVTRSDGQTTTALFLYFSYEGPVKGLPRK
jgi:hypothetical protein